MGKRIKVEELERYENDDVVVCVVWLDAFGEQCVDKNDRVDLPSCKLVDTKTYGKIGYVDDSAVEILQEESDTNYDIGIIPKSLILDIEVLE